MGTITLPDFDDITGWQEELEKLRKSDVYTKLYGKPGAYSTRPSPKIPLSVLYDYAELLLKHDETRNAVIALKEWCCKDELTFRNNKKK